MGALSRRKGVVHERELCTLIFDALGIQARRELSQTRDGGFDIALAPFAIECKSRKSHGRISQWLRQADTPGSMPLLALRENGGAWLVVLGLQDFFQIAREEIVARARKGSQP
jgi:hypothetical protein